MAEEIEVIVEDERTEREIPDTEQVLKHQTVNEYIEQLQRLQAEFENYRKRTYREREKLADEIRGDFCKQLLPILDDLERALNHDGADPDSLRSGLKLVNKNFTSILSNMGLKPIAALGQSFDPHVHEAVMVDSDPTVQNDTITEQLLSGYLFKDRLLRPAKVRVSKASEDIIDPQNSSEGTDSTHGQQRSL